MPVMPMSKKPLKHSELKKAEQTAASRLKSSWGKGRPQLPVIPIRPERYLIISEGTKTEPYYFGEMKKRINENYHGQYVTVTVQGEGKNTLSLFEQAREIAEGDADGFTQVWVVYDKDSFPRGNFNSVVEKCAQASKDGTEYRAVWSNESFELWYVLHFHYQQSALGREAYVEMLSVLMEDAGMGPYGKGRTDMYEILESILSGAIANAKKLEAVNAGKAPADANPGTTVHKLVEELLPYMKRLGEPEDE